MKADGSRVKWAKTLHLRPNPPKTHYHANPPLTLAVEVLQEGGELPAPQRVGLGTAAAAFLGSHGAGRVERGAKLPGQRLRRGKRA